MKPVIITLEIGMILKFHFSRLCSFESSFLPSTLKIWNELDIEIRSSPTLLQFKGHIKSMKIQVENFTNVGERKYNIIFTRIRHRCSSLRGDLSNVKIIPNSYCSCGAPLDQRTIGPENAHLKPDLGVLSRHEMTLTLNTQTPLLTSQVVCICKVSGLRLQ